MQRNAKRLIVATGWITAIVGWVLYQRSTGLGASGTLQTLVDAADGARWAFFIFIAIYAVRPLVLFPATLMTIAGGLLFGPVVGVLASLVGANASAMVAYWTARSLGFEGRQEREAAGLLARWSERMRNESFITIMLMRLAFLPYDGVNYVSGFLRIRPLAFLTATAIGSLPGTVSFTLAGASIESLEDGPSGIDPKVLIASIVLFVVSVGVSRVVKSHAAEPATAGDESVQLIESVEKNGITSGYL